MSTKPTEAPRCGEKQGTYAGWNVHNKAGEKPCDACQAANREYTRAWRARGGAAIENERARGRARSAALWRLKDMHRQEFDMLVEDEMRVERARQRAGRG